VELAQHRLVEEERVVVAVTRLLKHEKQQNPPLLKPPIGKR
jgi:hypothetical protein